VTSRSDLAGLVATEGARPVPVGPLPEPDARKLLAGRIGTAQVAAEPAAVEDLLRRCAGLPLALVLVAARAATRTWGSLDELSAELGQAGQGLGAFDVGDPLTNLRAVFDQSYRILGPDAAMLFRLLGSLPGAQHGVGALASAAALPVDRARTLLVDLARAHLLESRRPGHYSLHDLLRGYSVELAGADYADRWRAALHRMLDHYLHVAYDADRALAPYRDAVALGPVLSGVQVVGFTTSDAALAWFGAEWRVVVAVLGAAGGLGFDEHAWQLARAVTTYLDRSGRWMELLAVNEAGLAATQRLGDLTQQARLHRYLGGAYLRLDRAEDGLVQLRSALELNCELGNRADEAHTHQSIAWALRDTDLAGALRHVDQAYRLYQEIGDEYGQASMLNAIGWYQALRGNLQEAMWPARTAIGLFRRLGAVKEEADAWDTLGYVQLHLGYRRAAVHCLQRALRGQRVAADRDGELSALDHLGDAHAAAGDRLAAAAAWQAAAVLADELTPPDGSRIRAKLAGLRQ
jgi:tetratricopeptide (TPR) repeat protein